MKVGIVTINSFNYGNRLQNYALQEVIKSLGFSVDTIPRKAPLNFVGRIKMIRQHILGTKVAKFDSFEKNITKSKFIALANDADDNLSFAYDFFVAGSDQIWNPYYPFNGKSDLLFFAPPSKRISYAASFGVDSIPNEKEEFYKKYLSQFKAISIRETEGAKIVNKLIGIDAQVVLDPTLLFSKEKWSEIETKTSYSPLKPYVLVYSLGNKNDAFKENIRFLSKKYIIFDVRSLSDSGCEIAIGPSEFIYLIHHASIVLTDSFHASVFSILFHKRFITFNRPGLDMNSRIVSLAKTIKVEDLFDGNGDLYCDKGLDYDKIDVILEKERTISIEFLKKSLGE